MSNVKISGAVALVTGANRGIGKAIVEALLRRGAKKVYAAARKTQSLADVVKGGAGRVEAIELDVTNPSQVAAAVKRAGDVNLLINNAGLAILGEPLGDDAVARARREFDVNVFGLLSVTAAFAPALERLATAGQPAAVVNLNSVASLGNFPMLYTYSASKAASHSLTQGLRAMLAPKGIAIIGVYPGPVDTDMAADIPLDKATPESVANRILDGVEAGDPYVMPDAYAEDTGRRYFADPRKFEEDSAAAPAEA